MRWVADQLGHADPALTMRVYAHAMREEETDLSFADFSPKPGSRSMRLRSWKAGTTRKPSPVISLVGRPGLEPGTNGLKARCSTS